MQKQRLFVWLMLLFPSLSAWLYFDAYAGTAWALKIYGAGKIIQFTAPVFFYYWTGRGGFPNIEVRLKDCLWGLGTGLVMASAVLLAYFTVLTGRPELATTPVALRLKLHDFGISNPMQFLILASSISVLHSGLEEYFWRDFVYSELDRDFGPKAGYLSSLVASLAFAAHHVIVIRAYVTNWSLILLATAAIVFAGAVWCFLYQRTGRSIFASWLSHILCDAAIMAVGYHLAF